MPGRWLELLNKDNNQNQLPSSGVVFTAGPIEAREDTLVFRDKTIKLEDLEQLAPKAKR
jgi:acetyl-CoA carboxylase carboxyltransferase component